MSSELLLIVIGAYLVGSIPVARLIAKCERSGAPGSTSIPCIVKVLIDISKGLMVVTVGCLDGATAGLAALYGVFLGHAWPLWRHGLRGNGLGTLLGGLLALDPALGLSTLLSWMAAIFAFRSPQAAALLGAVGTLVAAAVLPLPFPATALLPLAALVSWRHLHTLRRALAADSSNDEADPHAPLMSDTGAGGGT